MANEFYLGALDLSPYIVSVWHRNYHTYMVEVDTPRTEQGKALRFELIDLRGSLYTIPVFIAYRGQSWAFVVKLDYSDSRGFMFTIRNPGAWALSGLLSICPTGRFMRTKSRIMA